MQMRRRLFAAMAGLAAAVAVSSFVVHEQALAQLVVGTMGGMTTYGGTWIDKDGTTKIPGVIAQPASGNFMETALTTSLTTAAATVLNVNPTGRRTALVIEITSGTGVVGCTDDGTVPVIGAGTTLVISGLYSMLNYSAFGLVPAGAIKCIASVATTITVRAS